MEFAALSIRVTNLRSVARTRGTNQSPPNRRRLSLCLETVRVTHGLPSYRFSMKTDTLSGNISPRRKSVSIVKAPFSTNPTQSRSKDDIFNLPRRASTVSLKISPAPLQILRSFRAVQRNRNTGRVSSFAAAGVTIPPLMPCPTRRYRGIVAHIHRHQWCP